MSYFFAAGHQNYARLGLVYVSHINESLLYNVLQHFLQGKRVTRHTRMGFRIKFGIEFIESCYGDRLRY